MKQIHGSNIDKKTFSLTRSQCLLWIFQLQTNKMKRRSLTKLKPIEPMQYMRVWCNMRLSMRSPKLCKNSIDIGRFMHAIANANAPQMIQFLLVFLFSSIFIGLLFLQYNLYLRFKCYSFLESLSSCCFFSLRFASFRSAYYFHTSSFVVDVFSNNNNKVIIIRSCVVLHLTRGHFYFRVYELSLL